MDDATTHESSSGGAARSSEAQTHLALTLVWSASEEEREGELIFLARRGEPKERIIGRGSAGAIWLRQRPGELLERGSLSDPKLSRQQLKIIRKSPNALEVHNLGRGDLVDPEGNVVHQATIRVGQSFGIAKRALFYLDTRPALLTPFSTSETYTKPSFGEADLFGLAGESPAMWRLRAELCATATQDVHTLVLGPSGAGKELAARAIHALSKRGKGPWVAQNAAAIPKSLLSAELFGNRQGYPNPGTPERKGLVGRAHQGVLMLDEIGELSHSAQAALLRVLDSGGSYQRLGEDRERRSDIRVLGVTNRPIETLKEDFSARFSLQVKLPTLAERRADIPFICRHLLGSAGVNRALGESFVRAMLRTPPAGEVRGLHAELMRAHRAKPEGPLEYYEIPEERGKRARGSESWSDADIKAALAAHYGDRSATARALGLKDRYALYRLLKARGITL